MRQRGRKSAVSLVTNVDGSPPKLEPPPYLRAAERALFNQLIAACDARHFVESDLPLLTSFVQATVLARNAARDPNKIEIWATCVRVQGMLATRLRLAPQARTDPKTLARQTARQSLGPQPWEL